MQPFLRNSCVAVDLPAQQRRDLLQFCRIRKVQNVRYIQDTLVRQTVFGGICDRLFQQDLAVPFLPNDVAVAVCDVYGSEVFPSPAGQSDIQHPGGIRAGDFDRGILRIGRDSLVQLRRNRRDDL